MSATKLTEFMMSNPLLENHTLPPFSKIKPSDIEPAISKLIEDNLVAIEKMLDAGANTWHTLIEPMELLDDVLSKAWSPVSHMNSVVNSPELRDAYNNCLPLLSDYSSKIGQNKRLYEAYQSISKSDAFKDFDQAQKKVIENALRDFKLAGVALEEKDKAEFANLKQELSKLQSKFSDNVLDATDHWFMLVEDANTLKGLPEHVITAAKEKAEKESQKGYRFGLDFPSYQAIMTYAEDRDLRKTMQEAFVTRASDQGPDKGKFDNSQLMNQIIDVRARLAKLLGFENFCDYSLATKMANDPKEVLSFLETLASKAKPFAQKDYDAVKQYANDEFGVEDFQPWDLAFYSEKLRKKNFDISQEELRPYFPLPVVMKGMFEIIQKLYGMRIEARKGVDTWHEDVSFFDLYDENNQLRGQFYFDLYARNQKRGGAWMDECRVRHVHQGQAQIPVAYLTCNFTPPVGGNPSLLTHDEVLTLFHEFGHGLHHVLTKIDYPPVSGINGVPWDAVELPSQFMENWCWEKDALKLISSHYQTNAPLPDDMLARLKAAKNFQAGLGMIRQLEFALFDFKMHLQYQAPDAKIQQTLDQVRAEYGVVPVPAYNRFQHSFSHIFAGGYAAGYYSYLWAERLSSDAFSRFEEEGIFNESTGRSFLNEILEKGGSQEPSDLFLAFRGRQPSIDPLLRHHGLIDAA